MAGYPGVRIIRIVRKRRLQPDNTLSEIVKDMGNHPCMDKRTP